jgi:hypothetical protein
MAGSYLAYSLHIVYQALSSLLPASSKTKVPDPFSIAKGKRP